MKQLNNYPLLIVQQSGSDTNPVWMSSSSTAESTTNPVWASGLGLSPTCPVGSRDVAPKPCRGREGVPSWLWGAQGARWPWPMLSGELTSTEDPPLHAADLRSPTEFCAKIIKPLDKAATESQKDKETCWSHLCLERCLSEMHKGWHYLSQSLPI